MKDRRTRAEPELSEGTHFYAEAADLAGDGVHASLDSGEFCGDSSQFGPEDVAQ